MVKSGSVVFQPFPLDGNSLPGPPLITAYGPFSYTDSSIQPREEIAYVYRKYLVSAFSCANSTRALSDAADYSRLPRPGAGGCRSHHRGTFSPTTQRNRLVS